MCLAEFINDGGSRSEVLDQNYQNAAPAQARKPNIVAEWLAKKIASVCNALHCRGLLATGRDEQLDEAQPCHDWVNENDKIMLEWTKHCFFNDCPFIAYDENKNVLDAQQYENHLRLRHNLDVRQAMKKMNYSDAEGLNV